MLTKKDWEDLKKSAEIGLKQAEISQIQYSSLLEICNKKSSELEESDVKKTEQELNDIPNAA